MGIMRCGRLDWKNRSRHMPSSKTTRARRIMWSGTAGRVPILLHSPGPISHARKGYCSLLTLVWPVAQANWRFPASKGRKLGASLFRGLCRSHTTVIQRRRYGVLTHDAEAS
ncbi:hypothetical protein BCV70DRAFT_47053 [Testicularia cyperi]|uniref:Uncharacterized protein n=1 Tax=Testicularia cyperi TaxID=1882483 RepID=A0A317XJH4_9BASI|nr:hypothetical protein BCV70DRAFT_47053 [Testicularia cyperi]